MTPRECFIFLAGWIGGTVFTSFLIVLLQRWTRGDT
jgi:hypothetical protein